jgi:hypothetical protein
VFQHTERNYVKKEGAPVSVRPCTLNTNQSKGTELQNSGVTVSKRCVLSTPTWNDRQVSLEAECVFEIAVSHKHKQRSLLQSCTQLFMKFATAELPGLVLLWATYDVLLYL